eukprot:evm.model.scf_77.8 EVM.evm.TU.scf_77.8   scf_77:145315-149603(-)
MGRGGCDGALAVPTSRFILSLFVPAWKSLEAIESPRSSDDRQWLSYWLLYAIAVMLEKALWPILQWVPLYMELKVAISAWLVLPQFKGALYMLQLHVLPSVIALRNYLRTVPVLEDLLRDTSSPKSATALPGHPAPHASADIAEKRAQAEALLTLARKVLDSRLESLEQAKAMGNVFEQKMAEKALQKSVERLDKVVTKGGVEDSVAKRKLGPTTHSGPHGNGEDMHMDYS